MKHNLVIKPRATDWIKGINSQIIVKSVGNGDWTPYWHFNEDQRNSDFDNDGCACYDSNKTADIWMDFLISQGQIAQSDVSTFLEIGLDGLPHFHSSPRFTENLTGNGINGNSEGECFDVIRKYGLVPYKAFPFSQTMTQAEYFTPPSADLLKQGADFLAFMGGKNFLQYHFVSNNHPKDLTQFKQAILQSPLSLGIAVTGGWNQPVPTDPPTSQAPQHAVVGLKIVGSDIFVSDNYPPYNKDLDAGYPINYCMQAVVTRLVAPPIPTPLPPNPTNPQISSWLDKVSTWLQAILNQLKVGNLQSNQMNYSILKSRTFWTIVFGAAYSIWQLFEPSVNPSVSAIIDVLVTSLAAYFHVQGVQNAAVSSASLSQPVSGQ